MIDKAKTEHAVTLLLEAIGEEPSRPGLLETPERVAKMYVELLKGMEENPGDHLAKTFEVSGSNLVLEKNISFHSMCEHHLLPFWGEVHIAYIGQDRVIGLSKLARTVEVFARRLQLQEQMTNQIAMALMEHLTPQGVMVIITAEHMCMSMRGIKKPGAKTQTVVAKGIFAEDRQLYNQVLLQVQ